MHAQTLSPLALVLPHPHIPRRTSSLRSINTAASPRTPRSCGSPANSIFVPNRKSTDSWNSSNADELEWEWKPEQILLLSRTLDALPAHLVTPFNGPIPPSNLLDKIARGVSQAKGPIDWPHSLRATRVKLIELSRLRAKEQSVNHRRESIAEEPEDAQDTDFEPNYTYSHTKRPLYRQSSMDFILNTPGNDIKNNENLARLSSRLQRAERQAAHHPYQRAGRTSGCTSPPPSSAVPSLITPSTPSSSTLNTLSSLSVQRRNLRRTVSSVSSSSLSIISTSSSEAILPNPRVQRLMQDDAIAPLPPPKDTPTKTATKRASAFGTIAQEARRDYLTQSPDNRGHARKNSGGCPSSDEEEKIRNKQAKKARKHSICTPSRATATPPPESPATPMTPASPIITRRITASKLRELKGSSPREAKTEKQEKSSKDKKENLVSLGKDLGRVKTRPLPMNLQRNPSMFGHELPPLPADGQLSPAPVITSRIPRSPSPASLTCSIPRAFTSLRPGLNHSSSPSSTTPSLLSPPADINIPASPSPKIKTLRRVRRLPPARRISFSSLAIPPGDEADADGEGEGEEKGSKIELGSAFQLQ